MSTSEQSLAEKLACEALETAETRVSRGVSAKVRQHLLDAVASAFIGCRSQIFRDLAASVSNPGSAALPARADLAMLWGFAINGSVSEDGSREGACHPAAAVMPVVMAFGEGMPISRIEQAVVAGYDVMIRIARAGNPLFARKGFHGTAVTAPFGAATALAVLKGFEADKTAGAIRVAAQGGSGLMAAFRSGPSQPLQVAWGVRNGVAAALLAASGHGGYRYILEEGFFPAYLEKGGDEKVMEPLEKLHAIESCYLKPYPGCRHMHASLEAFSTVMEQSAASHENISSISVKTYRVALETGIRTLGSRGDAYFNIPYAIAARAVLGEAVYDSFDERHFDNPAIVRLLGLISEQVDEEIEALYPGQRGARVEVTFADGRTLSHRVSYPLGEPESPLSADVTREKFISCTSGVLTATEQKKTLRLLDAAADRMFFASEKLTRHFFDQHNYM